MAMFGFEQTDYIYHGIFIFASVYQLFLYIDALRQRNIFQLLALILFGLLFVIMAVIHVLQHFLFEEAGCYQPLDAPVNNITNYVRVLPVIFDSDSPRDYILISAAKMKPFQYATLAIVPWTFFIILIAAIKLYYRFHWGNYNYHHISNSKDIWNAVIAWGTLTGLLKVYYFFLFAYAIQLVPSTLMGYKDIWAFEGALVLLVGLVVFLLVIFYGIRYESAVVITLFALFTLITLGYFGYRTFTFAIARETHKDIYELTSLVYQKYDVS
ncbi:hypothetical protein G6F44_002391 [Rhizopus delemar]|nr:hypothetical protein G6F44_002391 [Rhizopus delemar]